MAYDKVVDSSVLNSGLTKIANAIRSKGGTTNNIAFPDGFASAISALTAGGTLSISTENLHNTASDKANKYFSNGALVDYNSWSATDYIPVTKGKLYVVSSNANIEMNYSGFFDQNKKYISSISYTGGIRTPGFGGFMIFESPITGYIAFSALINTITSLRISECQTIVTNDANEVAY